MESLFISEGNVTYNYDDLLDHITTQFKDKSDKYDEGIKLNETNFVLAKLGIKRPKTLWKNFDQMVTEIGRKHEHMMSYFSAELGCEVTLGRCDEATNGQDNVMILMGKYSSKVIERLYK